MKIDELHPWYDELSSFLTRLKNGGVGVKPPKGTWESNIIGSRLLPAVDLADTTSANELNVHYVFCRSRERFDSRAKKEGPPEVYRTPRYFQIGPTTQKDERETMVDINVQLEMVQHVMGTHPSIVNTSIGERRKQYWEDWATEGSRTYTLLDLPVIMDEYLLTRLLQAAAEVHRNPRTTC